MMAGPFQLVSLANRARSEYERWLRRIREYRGEQQLDLFERRELVARAWFWRGTWYACERELRRVMRPAAVQGRPGFLRDQFYNLPLGDCDGEQAMTATPERASVR